MNKDPVTDGDILAFQQADIHHPPDSGDIHPREIEFVRADLDDFTRDAQAHRTPPQPELAECTFATAIDSSISSSPTTVTTSTTASAASDPAATSGNARSKRSWETC